MSVVGPLSPAAVPGTMANDGSSATDLRRVAARVLPIAATVAALACASALALPLAAETREEGLRRFEAGDYEGALERWLPLAEAAEPDVAALVGVARVYAHPEFSGVDPAEAQRYFRKAAELGDADGQAGLALSLLTGAAGPPEIAEGLEWLEKAAVGGSAEAQYEFALHLLGNEDSEEVRAQGLEWLRKSAGQGLAGAQNHLGWFYLNAQEGLPQDYAAAREWFQRAAEAGHPHAHFNLGTMLQKGFGTEVDLPRAFTHYLKAAELGHLLAMSNVGSMYAHGTGVEADFVLAREWMKKAARQGLPFAQANLPLLFDSKELETHFDPWLALEHEFDGLDDAEGEDGYHAVIVAVEIANQERHFALPLYRVPRAEFVLSAPRPGFPDEFRRPVVPPLDVRKVRPLSPEDQRGFLEAHPGNGIRIAYPPFVAAMSGLPPDEEELASIQERLEALYERTSVEPTQQSLDDAFEGLMRQLREAFPEMAPE